MLLDQLFLPQCSSTSLSLLDVLGITLILKTDNRSTTNSHRVLVSPKSRSVLGHTRINHVLTSSAQYSS